MAEALVSLGAAVGLEVVRGTPTPAEAAHLGDLGVHLVGGAAGDGGRLDAAERVIVDLPDVDAVARRYPADRLTVLDDRDAFTGLARVVVQPSLPRWSGRGRADVVLAGYEYVPLRAAFRLLHDRLPDRAERTAGGDASSERLRVVVCFGGSDPSGVTERLAPALTGGVGWRAEIIVGASHGGPSPAGSPTVVPDPAAVLSGPPAIVRDPADLPERLAAADLVVVGAGTMKFEVACLGRPALLVAVADDQLDVGPPFAATGAAVYVGDGRTIEPAGLRAAIDGLAGDPARRATIGWLAHRLVDARGAERIAAVVLAGHPARQPATADRPAADALAPKPSTIMPSTRSEEESP